MSAQKKTAKTKKPLEKSVKPKKQSNKQTTPPGPQPHNPPGIPGR